MGQKGIREVSALQERQRVAIKRREAERKPRNHHIRSFGALSKNCDSISCQDLRRADANTRLELLKANKDCVHCCGDHDSVNCNKKGRICGGGNVDRGCSQKHAGHELFCVGAKVFSVSQVHLQQDSSDSRVVLLITTVQCTKQVTASVFWDQGSTSNFFRSDFARR